MRFSSQMNLQGFGSKGQDVLSSSKVVVVGIGALGSVSSQLLVRAGVGKVTVIDRDFVDESNLQRQVLYKNADVGKPKAAVAGRELRRFAENKSSIISVSEDLNSRNVERYLRSADLVIDGLDNLETRFLVNDACKKLGIPWVYAGAVGFQGLSMNVLPGKRPCFAEVFKQAAPGALATCETHGVLNAASHFAASYQVSEAFKILLGKQPSDHLFSFDLQANAFRLFNLKPAKTCKPCSGQFDYLDASAKAAKLCGSNAFHLSSSRNDIDLKSLSKNLSKVGIVNRTRYGLQFSLKNGKGFFLFKSGRAIVKNVSSEKEARSFYAKYVSV